MEETRGEGGGLGDTFGDNFWVVYEPPRHFGQKGQDSEVKIKLPLLVNRISQIGQVGYILESIWGKYSKQEYGVRYGGRKPG